MKNYELLITNYESKTHKAFTLIELLVSIAVFVVFLGAVSISYIGIVRSQRNANTVRKMYSEVRTFVDSLSQDMRLGTIDYDCYPDPNKGNTVSSNCPISSDVSGDTGHYLAIVNKDGTQKTAYWFNNGQIKVGRWQLSDPDPSNGVAGWGVVPGFEGGISLFSNLVTVKNIDFMIYPLVNPYASANYSYNQYQFQPKVTMTMTVQNAASNLPPFDLNFQTTLSSRVYSRSNS